MFKLFYDLSMLSMEANQVVWLRSAKLAMGGPGAEREARQMITEKVVAMNRAASQLSMGATPETIVRGLRQKVQANARRLAKG